MNPADFNHRQISFIPMNQHNAIERDTALQQASMSALAEARLACAKWNAFNSTHEGYAVILEELDELWDEVKKKNPSKDALRLEARHVAAMALRFIAELT
jgi:hypothetical protein